MEIQFTDRDNPMHEFNAEGRIQDTSLSPNSGICINKKAYLSRTEFVEPIDEYLRNTR